MTTAKIFLLYWSSRFLDSGEILRIALIDGHEGFISHFLLLKLTHGFLSIGCAEVKLELCGV